MSGPEKDRFYIFKLRKFGYLQTDILHYQRGCIQKRVTSGNRQFSIPVTLLNPVGTGARKKITDDVGCAFVNTPGVRSELDISPLISF